MALTSCNGHCSNIRNDSGHQTLTQPEFQEPTSSSFPFNDFAFHIYNRSRQRSTATTNIRLLRTVCANNIKQPQLTTRKGIPLRQQATAFQQQLITVPGVQCIRMETNSKARKFPFQPTTKKGAFSACFTRSCSLCSVRRSSRHRVM